MLRALLVACLLIGAGSVSVAAAAPASAEGRWNPQPTDTFQYQLSGAIDTSVDPSTGSRLLLIVFAASVLGGMTILPGAVLGALLIGVFSEVSLSVVSPVYQSAMAFLAILVVLLVRPNGLFSGISGVRK